MSNKANNLLGQPYPLYLEFSKTFPVIVGIGLFIPFFLFTFQPFGLTESDLARRALFLAGFGIVTFAALCLNVYGVVRLFPGIFEEDRWTVGKEILWVLWNVFACVTASAVYEFIQPDCPFTFPQLIVGYSQGFLMSIVPVSLVVSMAYMAFLRTRLRRAEAITRKLSAFVGSKEEEMLKLVSEAGKEKVKLRPKDLLFIQSTDNYVTIVSRREEQTEKRLLRSSLTRLEDQISLFSYIVRCHRSFIVNLAKVRSVAGNANGYRLHLQWLDEPIPVARRFGRPVLNALETLELSGRATSDG